MPFIMANNVINTMMLSTGPKRDFEFAIYKMVILTFVKAPNNTTNSFLKYSAIIAIVPRRM